MTQDSGDPCETFYSGDFCEPTDFLAYCDIDISPNNVDSFESADCGATGDYGNSVQAGDPGEYGELGKYSEYGKYCECGDFDDSGESS